MFFGSAVARWKMSLMAKAVTDRPTVDPYVATLLQKIWAEKRNKNTTREHSCTDCRLRAC